MQPETPQQTQIPTPSPEPVLQPTPSPEVMPIPSPVPTLEPVTVITPMTVVKNSPRQRHFLATFFISFMWGVVGADRMYMGFWGLGILKLITLGGFGIWVIVDLFLVMGGYMRDKQGREMLQVAEYKKFAYRTVLIFAISIGAIVLVNGILLILGLNELISSFNDGSIPGLDSLNGTNGLPTDLQQELGL